MSSSTLFRTATQKTDDNTLPVLSDKQKQAVNAGANIIYRDSYIYSNDRAKGHIDAQTALQTLYHVGAELINSGKAYLPDVELDGLNTNLGPAKTNQQKAIQALLMDTYRSRPKTTVKNGSHTASNPLPALFVIRVALDHMTPQSIYLMFTALKIHSIHMSYMPNVITFPNGSEFLGDYAAMQILRGYILNHKEDFRRFLSDQEIKASVEQVTYFAASYDCIGSSPDIATIEDILRDATLKPVENLAAVLKPTKPTM